ncbi:MAG: HEPN domain-containing protein [Proteobacteria bacterium]|nr:HEPN domain-containing protein [Pseudomonadota bacterium]
MKLFKALNQAFCRVFHQINSPILSQKMKSSLKNLPKLKQNELQKIVQIIRENCQDVEKIILFGSYARGTFKEEKDINPHAKSGHPSDYDILVVTATKEVALDSSLWRKISDECKKLHASALIKILTHDIQELNIKLAEAQYFFSDIKKDGITLFDSGKFELAKERNLTPQEKRRIAQDHFDHWFQRSKNFYAMYRLMFEDKQWPDAAFDLHQAAESAYKAVLLVFSNYTPKEHFLEFLGARAEQYCWLMQNIFAKIDKEDEERFKLLEYAYIGGRYDPHYRICKEDLEILEVQVLKLMELTKQACEEKISLFC